MTDKDLDAFVDIFNEVALVLRERRDLDEKRASYFRALRHWPIEDVKAAARTVMNTLTEFPKPADWISAMPRRQSQGDLRQMSAVEAKEYWQAAAAHWQGPVCSCKECMAANITDAMPLRFVPDEKVWDPARQQAVDAGHWAHGQELRRWYEAKGHYYARFATFVRKHTLDKPTRRQTFEERLVNIFGKPTGEVS